jgi:hypothetical protein
LIANDAAFRASMAKDTLAARRRERRAQIDFARVAEHPAGVLLPALMNM